MRILLPLLLLVLTGCDAIRPQRGGGATTTLGGAVAPTVVRTTAPENPQTPTSTTVEKTTTREFSPAKPAPQQDRSAVDRPAHTREATGSNPVPAPNLEREIVHEIATTQTGAAQKDTARELGVKLANMRGVMWVGVVLLLGGVPLGIKLGWFVNGCIVSGTGLLLIILAQAVPGNAAWFGLGGLFLCVLVAYVYYRAHHDATIGAKTSATGVMPAG